MSVGKTISVEHLKNLIKEEVEIERLRRVIRRELAGEGTLDEGLGDTIRKTLAAAAVGLGMLGGGSAIAARDARVDALAAASQNDMARGIEDLADALKSKPDAVDELKRLVEPRFARYNSGKGWSAALGGLPSEKADELSGGSDLSGAHQTVGLARGKSSAAEKVAAGKLELHKRFAAGDPKAVAAAAVLVAHDDGTGLAAAVRAGKPLEGFFK